MRHTDCNVPQLYRCLTVRELARRWRCRPSTIRSMVRRGVLPAMQLNGRVRITPEAIRAAETGPLAVSPIRRRRVGKVDPEIAKLLK
jgi:excisionase family DNA binding protein